MLYKNKTILWVLTQFKFTKYLLIVLSTGRCIYAWRYDPPELLYSSIKTNLSNSSKPCYFIPYSLFFYQRRTSIFLNKGILLVSAYGQPTGCPTKLFPLLFIEFLAFLEVQKFQLGHLSTAHSMQISKISNLLLFGEILTEILAKY